MSYHARNGFRINGSEGYRVLGTTVSDVGDINGDGIDDLLIGGPTASPRIIFGDRSSFNYFDEYSSFLYEGKSFRIEIGGLQSASRAGDFNGDGIADVIIGQLNIGNYSEPRGPSSSYIVFGSRDGFPSDFNQFDGSRGIRISRGDTLYADGLGSSVSSAGDLNADGIDDIIIADSRRAQSFVVFGKTTGFPGDLSLNSLGGLDGFKVINSTPRYRLYQAYSNYNSSDSVSGGSDLNADGIDDVIVRFVEVDENGSSYNRPAKSYVVHGQRDRFAATVDVATLNNSTGFQFDGNLSVVNDINGDNVDDFSIVSSDRIYVVLGTSKGFAADLDLSTLNGTNGFRIDDNQRVDRKNPALSAGDVNGDGVNDLLIGSSVIYGSRTQFSALLDLTKLDGKNGFQVSPSLVESGFFGSSISKAGDINADGFGDIIFGGIGNSTFPVPPIVSPSYVLFGSALPIEGLRITELTVDASDVAGGSIDIDLLSDTLTTKLDPLSIKLYAPNFVQVTGTDLDDSIWGDRANNTLRGNGGADRLLGRSGNDRLIGGNGDDFLIGATGQDRFVFEADQIAFADPTLFDKSLYAFKNVYLGIDTIADFAPGEDKMVLDKTTFTKLGQRVRLATVKTVENASQSKAQIVYVYSTGELFYNPNRAVAGFGEGGQFANIGDGLTLKTSDFIYRN